MKKTILFKTLVDLLYIFHFIGLIGIVLILPFGTISINQAVIDIEDWNLFYWLIFSVSLGTYIVFLRGLYFLRKMSRALLSNKYFSESIITNLKRSGNHFLIAGVFSLSLSISIEIRKFFEDKFELIYDNNLLIGLFLTMIGLFFIIQSNTLTLLKVNNEENKLTV